MTDSEEKPGVNGTVPEQPAQEEVRIPTVDMTDEQAAQLVMPLAVALERAHIFEGAMMADRLSMRRIHGELAMHIAQTLIVLMRGKQPALQSVRKTLRDLFRGLPFPSQVEHLLNGLHPNSKPVHIPFDINDDDGTPAAKVQLSVSMVPTIIIPTTLRRQ